MINIKKHKRKICKNIQKYGLKNDSAITLISLVVTIIVLLILAGVMLQIIMGENGIFAKAQQAKKRTEESQKIENEAISEINKRLLEENKNIKVKIIYNGNSGQGLMETTEIEKNTEVTLKANTYTKSGYIFKNWNTKPDGTGTEYKNESNIKINDDITLYAIWQIKEKWQIWLENAEIDYTKFNTLEEFIESSTDEEKNKLSSNINAMKYLRENSDLIADMKSKSNYEKIAKYLLSTDSTINNNNYKLGLPCYIFNGKQLYIGGNWQEGKKGYGSYSTSDSKITLSIPAVEGWDYCLRTSNNINLSGYSGWKGYGNVQKIDKGTRNNGIWYYRMDNNSCFLGNL